MVVPANTFHQPQIWALSPSVFNVAPRPISTNIPEAKSSMAPSSASASGKAQMLRDFSLQIYDKQELQFMDRSNR
uniref:Transcription factor TCP19 n=1 Tax=Cajanus cajan TaxID=3821 RepID=A0A151SNY9_CAJCA|nr:Transcription factor TCP19 [Cajanus cajan]